MICSVGGCEKNVKARGYCSSHYALWRRNGEPARVLPKTDYQDTCTAPGCMEAHSAKGYCSKHYARVVKYGCPDLPVKEKWRCVIDGCDAQKHKAKGFCAFHYERMVNETRMDLPRRVANAGQDCSVNGCNDPARSRGMCIKHAQRWRKHGDPERPAGKRRENGSGKDWHAAPSGYVVRYEPENPNAGPNGQVYQHRHVMSEMIGRPLRSDENVHHINGDRADNRPENLELWTRGQPAGQRIQDRVKWHIAELTRDMDAAVALDGTLKAELLALALRLKVL